MKSMPLSIVEHGTRWEISLPHLKGSAIYLSKTSGLSNVCCSICLYDLVLQSSGCVDWQQASRLVHKVHNVAARHRKGLVTGWIQKEYLIPGTAVLTPDKCAAQSNAIGKTLQHKEDRLLFEKKGWIKPGSYGPCCLIFMSSSKF